MVLSPTFVGSAARLFLTKMPTKSLKDHGVSSRGCWNKISKSRVTYTITRVYLLIG